MKTKIIRFEYREHVFVCISITYLCECTCASSCPTSGGIVYHNIGMDTAVYRCELADVLTAYLIS